MEYKVRHRTAYRYLQDVSYSCHLAHLTPRETKRQRVLHSNLGVTPRPVRHLRKPDYFGNQVEWFALDQSHTYLEVICESRVSVSSFPMPDPLRSENWEAVRELLEWPFDGEARDAVQYSFDSPLTAFTIDVAAYARKSFAPKRPLLDSAIDLMKRIYSDFRYDTTVTDASTTIDDIFGMRAGVCQDLAHVGIACMRSMGLPARYVSGYLLTQPPPGQQRLVGADPSHAWFSVWAPSLGWIDLDPTNNLLPSEKHVTVAWGRDFSDVSPLGGVITGGGEHVMEVGVDVAPT